MSFLALCQKSSWSNKKAARKIGWKIFPRYIFFNPFPKVSWEEKPRDLCPHLQVFILWNKSFWRHVLKWHHAPNTCFQKYDFWWRYIADQAVFGGNLCLIHRAFLKWRFVDNFNPLKKKNWSWHHWDSCQISRIVINFENYRNCFKSRSGQENHSQTFKILKMK